ncbi:hypothetical protein skT53_33800 [Effusibacillus dendaii]|uniref:Uncharacterized protein n=1 Tax=Effusibacillus dendaii TaxID=2743772 RepID=A0A7I8DE57_9BACL|nr:hypothetical protein skT53_33800 [Effusibacillus dendaii]
MFLADAARANGGKVYTCENDSFKIELAKQTFEKAGLDKYIELIEGDLYRRWHHSRARGILCLSMQ